MLNYFLAYLIKGIMRLILFTCHIEILGIENLTRIKSNDKAILTLWHNRLAILPEILNNNTSHLIYRACISKSKDAEILSIMINTYRNGRSLRIPHNRRREALLQIIENLNSGGEIIVITPDGPKGPVNRVKPGVIVAAQKSSSDIIPFSWSANRYWQLKTWDSMLIPKPFAKIRAVFGLPISHAVFQGSSLEENTKMLSEILLSMENSC